MADSVAVDEQKFSLKEVHDVFKDCLLENEEVSITHYVAAWRMLVRFMNSLGSVFLFISKDAVSKIEILVNFTNGENGSHYVTIQSMVKYELENDLVDINGRGSHPESGCRTLLRLHRAMRWLELFMERLRTSTEDCKTSVMGAETYSESLGKHHPRVVRAAVKKAFLVLPSRAKFFKVMNVGTPEQVVAVLTDGLPLISEVYRITEDIYAQHNLLEIP